MYDPREILRRSPEEFRELVLTILAVLVILGAVKVSGEAVALIGLLVLKLMGMFYVKPAQRAKTDADLTAINQAVADAAAVVPARPIRLERKANN